MSSVSVGLFLLSFFVVLGAIDLLLTRGSFANSQTVPMEREANHCRLCLVPWWRRPTALAYALSDLRVWSRHEYEISRIG